MRGSVAFVAVLASACGGAPASRAPEPIASASPAPASQAPPSSGSDRSEDAGASADASDPTSMNVTGHAGASNEFDISGRSDLPDGIPSTAQPFLHVIETAVAPIRPALAECMRELGASAPRYYRVTVETDGRLEPRAPQPVALPARVAACAEGVVQGTTVTPTPPMTIPFDIFLPGH